MKLPRRRQFLHLAVGAVALPAMSEVARARRGRCVLSSDLRPAAEAISPRA
jgi:hypothetical protein